VALWTWAAVSARLTSHRLPMRQTLRRNRIKEVVRS
jgi:hypothetical protein